MNNRLIRYRLIYVHFILALNRGFYIWLKGSIVIAIYGKVYMNLGSLVNILKVVRDSGQCQ